MPAKVILNPYSNRWIAGTRRGEVEEALREAGVEYDLVVSEGPGQITGLAEAAARAGFSPILVAGGDGSIGETVNGLLNAAEGGALTPMGLLPLGTANDLVDNVHYPTDLKAAAKIIAAGTIRAMDLCQVTDLRDGQVRYFANNSAIGFEPYVTLVQQKIHWIKGMIRYLVAAVRGIMDGPAWKGRLEWDGGSYEGPITLVTVCNGARSGGVFYMAPHADPFDGKLTFVHAYRGSRAGMFALLPKAMKPGAGSYVESPGVYEIHTTWLKIHLENPSPAHIDGEIFSRDVCDLEYRLVPGKIKMVM
jgi:diacylglycerol kinase (ATP)